MTKNSIVRCSVPDCDWGFILSHNLDISDSYEPFRLHCINQHGLGADDTEPDSLGLGKAAADVH
jgi:hypothetical protein